MFIPFQICNPFILKFINSFRRWPGWGVVTFGHTETIQKILLFKNRRFRVQPLGQLIWGWPLNLTCKEKHRGIGSRMLFFEYLWQRFVFDFKLFPATLLCRSHLLPFLRITGRCPRQFFCSQSMRTFHHPGGKFRSSHPNSRFKHLAHALTKNWLLMTTLCWLRNSPISLINHGTFHPRLGEFFLNCHFQISLMFFPRIHAHHSLSRDLLMLGLTAI